MSYMYWYNYEFRWYHLIFPAIVLLVVLPLFVWFMLNVIGVIHSTPDWAIQGFCHDLEFQEMNNAYNLFSSDYQNSHTPADFLQTWSNKGCSTYVFNVSDSSDGKATGILTTPDTVYHVTLIQNNIVDWKISSINP